MQKIRTVNVHAGHTPAYGKAPGAVSILNESVEDRKIVKRVIKLLRTDGCTVYNCTSSGSSQSDNLHRIVKKCNAHPVDIDVSIHLNSGRNDKKGDKKTGGVEVLIKTSGGCKAEIASDICKNVSDLGFTNRGIKIRTDLYVLNHTKSPALLVEACFVDDKDDANLYNNKDMAYAIASGIVGHDIYKKPVFRVGVNSSASDIKWLQSRLNECIIQKGFKKIPVNGLWSFRTRDAINIYRRQMGWKVGSNKLGSKAGFRMINALYNLRVK